MSEYILEKFGRVQTLCGRILPQKTSYRWFLGIFFVFVTIGGLFGMSQPASAFGEASVIWLANGLIWLYSEVLTFLATLAIRMAMFALQFFIDLAAYNGYVDAPAVVVGWFMLRDFANMLFIVGLLAIAIGTILGKEQYEWKKALVKLIFAAIFINFSRMILGLIIDASHIVMLTFLNAIQGAAGGNFIEMFGIEKMLKLSGQDTVVQGSNLREDIFAASVASFVFAFVAMLTIAAYTALMLGRMLILWMLIILSPLAFVFQAIPQTQSYAKEFWDEFIKYILVGPIMVFFLWLAFATMGSGDISTQILVTQDPSGVQQVGLSRAGPSAGLGEIMKWENLASYFIAVGFLLYGLERVGKLGVRGGSLVGTVATFGTAAATMLGGVAAGRWLARKGAAGAVAGAKAVAGGLAEKTYIPHLARIGAEKVKQGYYSTLGDGSLRRAGSVAAYKETTENVKKRITAEGNRESWAGQALGRSTIELNNEKRRGDAEQKAVESRVRVDIMMNERRELDGQVNQAVANARAAGTPMNQEDIARFQQEYIDRNADRLPALSAALAEARSKRQTGRAESGEAGTLADIQDMDRILQGNDPKYRILHDQKEARAGLDDASKLDTDERFDAIRRNFQRIRDAQASGNTTALAQARRNMDNLMQSALEQGDGNGLLGILRDLNGDFSNTTLSAETIPQVLMGLHGFAHADVTTGTGLQDAETELRRNFGPREGDMRMRNLGIAMNAYADKVGAHQFRGQVIKGRDQDGNLVNGLAANMTAGAGTAGSFGTGTADNGRATQRNRERFARQSQRLTAIPNSNALFATNADGRAVGLASTSPDIQRMLNTLGTATVGELRSTHRSVFNHLAGGTASNGRTDATNPFGYAGGNNFVLDAATQLPVINQLRRVIQIKRDRATAALGTNKEADRREEYLELLRKLTGNEGLAAPAGGGLPAFTINGAAI